MQEARKVVTLVQILEEVGENLRLLVWQLDTPLARGCEELLSARLGEPGRARKHVLMGGEQPMVLTNRYRHDSRVEFGGTRANRGRRVGTSLVQRLPHPLLGVIAKRALRNLPRLAGTVLGRCEGPLEHLESENRRAVSKRVMDRGGSENERWGWGFKGSSGVACGRHAPFTEVCVGLAILSAAVRKEEKRVGNRANGHICTRHDIPAISHVWLSLNAQSRARQS